MDFMFQVISRVVIFKKSVIDNFDEKMILEY